MNQALNDLLAKLRRGAKTDREKGAYFEELILTYPLKLFQRVITVSLETLEIVRSLAKLEIQGSKRDRVA